MKNTELSGTKLKALAGVCLSSLMFGLEISSVPVILPAIKNTLHANFTELQWIMNAYTIACTAVLMGIGALSDRFGRKLIFLISVALFGISSFTCGVSQSVAVLISFRAVQGMSGGAMLICQVSTLSNLFPDGKERARAFSYWGIIFGVGLGFGPIIGGGILAVSSWEWVFLIHVLISFITFYLIYSGVGEIRQPTKKGFDYIGMFSLTFSVLFITYFITQSSGEEMRTTALIPLLLAVVCLLVFLFAEKKAADPVIDFSVFRVPAFTGAVLGSIGMNISFWPFMIYLPIYFQNALGYDSTFTGLTLLAYSLPPLFLPPLAEKLSLRYSAGRVIPFTLLTIGVGFFLMWLGSRSPHAGWLTLLPGLITAGAGLGMTNTPVSNTITASVDRSRSGMASGIDMSARMITLAINIAIMGAMLLDNIVEDLKQVMSAGSGNVTPRKMAELLLENGIGSAHTTSGIPDSILAQSVSHGFGSVMLYGAVGVSIAALFSFIAFRLAPDKARPGVLSQVLAKEEIGSNY